MLSCVCRRTLNRGISADCDIEKRNVELSEWGCINCLWKGCFGNGKSVTLAGKNKVYCLCTVFQLNGRNLCYVVLENVFLKQVNYIVTQKIKGSCLNGNNRILIFAVYIIVGYTADVLGVSDIYCVGTIAVGEAMTESSVRSARGFPRRFPFLKRRIP